MGFVLGTTVAEQLRTFAGKIFRLDDHLARLEQSLEIIGVDPGIDRKEMACAAAELAERNHRLLDPNDDLGLSIFVTPGQNPSYSSNVSTAPTAAMHTYALSFRMWAEKYGQGQSLVTTAIEQVSSRCWPPNLKCRSRMHYYLADREAAKIEPGARALLLDADGAVSEASTANIAIYTKADGLLAPPHAKVLPGISLAEVTRLADRLRIPNSERNLTLADVASADEVMLTSTPFCLLPVTRLNTRPIGDGSPGPVFRRILAAWSESVGVDIATQARRFADRS
jgi:branched-subunit amino acid aminotransferase/4-amino-4-deoxychorismate lyase